MIRLTRVFQFSIISASFALFAACGNEEPSQEEQSIKGPVTYSEHVAPIIYKHCSGCHRPGEAGPFPLLSYIDASSRAKLIKYVTTTRFMPPWPADAGYVHFIDEKVLSKKEIAIIAKWVDEGAPEGDRAKAPAAPEFPKGSQLGKPDMVISFREPFQIPGDGQDRFMLMRVPYKMEQDREISVIEVVPGNRKLVHHVNAQLLSYEPGKRKDVFAGEVAVDINDFPDKLSAYKALALANDDGTFPKLTPSVTNYLPGVTPPIYPEGIGGYYMTKEGALFLKDMHYGPSRVDTSDVTTFNVFFAKSPPKRRTQEFQMGTYGVSPVVPELSIPADSIKTFTSDYIVPFDLSVLTVNPHMHLIGTKFLAYAVTPQQDTIRMIRINRWDFRWQYFYTYEKMLKIPKGSRIHVEAEFDNTRKNPNNPFSPPRLIAEREGSMRTSDEMLQFIITYLPYQPGDENISLKR
jgi:hypothetical protein